MSESLLPMIELQIHAHLRIYVICNAFMRIYECHHGKLLSANDMIYYFAIHEFISLKRLHISRVIYAKIISNRII